jgi:hypothetical protein
MLSVHRRRFLLALVWAPIFAAKRADAADVTLNVPIEHGRVPESQRRIRVSEGDVVHLRFTVDRPMTLHLHGYDIEQRVEPGSVGTLNFEARATGRFALHAHDAGGGRATHEEAPTLYVEVYPR